MVSNILKLTLAATALLASACAKTETTAAVEKTADTVSATAQVVESKRIARGGNIVAVSEEGGKKYIVGPNGDAVVKVRRDELHRNCRGDGINHSSGQITVVSGTREFERSA